MHSVRSLLSLQLPNLSLWRDLERGTTLWLTCCLYVCTLYLLKISRHSQRLQLLMAVRCGGTSSKHRHHALRRRCDDIRTNHLSLFPQPTSAHLLFCSNTIQNISTLLRIYSHRYLERQPSKWQSHSPSRHPSRSPKSAASSTAQTSSAPLSPPSHTGVRPVEPPPLCFFRIKVDN